MSKESGSRSELVNRWTKIEREEELNDIDDPSIRRRIHQLKEEWFVDAYSFFIGLPKENHVWCGNWDLMGPFLETFYNYNKDDRDDCPLKMLWKKVSEEMRHCIQCISQHHQAQETYHMEYELSCIAPLLNILQSLDEERVTERLREINSRLKSEKYDPLHHNSEVVSLMYEVLMFPILLDDQLLLNEFEFFIEAVETKHELALAGNQQFPGVYALLFFNRRARTIGRRLARSMRKIRSATDLEPLQPFLSKFISFLETEQLPVASNTSRPRSQLERLSIWLGMSSLLEFLEPQALEEGILERYPIFFDTILNHISGDSAEFSHAVNCLKELFKMLGCKLWLRSTLSPSVMRNTLLGQCFHTRSEKIHKDIFDLFLPFLQSLEALQDGDHEKQRRHFLYFLLHQVSMSSNFNSLTRKLACKIALLIIRRGYQMNPPCPPFECAHMWGPSLVSVLKDASLHSSLRQPAFDLIETIVVSDASALVTSLFNCQTSLENGRGFTSQLNDEVSMLAAGEAEDDKTCWSEFKTQSNVTTQECRGWMCIPMLWVDVLADIHPSGLPISFSKAVLWARSRMTMVEHETTKILMPVKTWLSSSAMEISTSFGWKAPTGYDDGSEGNKSKNAIEVSIMQRSLSRIFNRLTEHFLAQIGEGELHKQWMWDSKMAESLILLHVDPNDNVRQFGKHVLEHVSNTRGLASGLKFLCSNVPSLSATFMGLQHALKVVEVDSVISKFQNLQHFFFVLYKLIKGGDSSNLAIQDLSDNSNTGKYFSQGGFLKHPVFDSLAEKTNGKASDVDSRSQEKFRLLLSVIAWPAIQKCLMEGKGRVSDSVCQMTCIRVLDILHIVCERIVPPIFGCCGHSVKLDLKFDFAWLHDLMDWGKSTLKVVIVYWKRAVTSLLNLFNVTCNNANSLIIKTIEDLNSCDNIDIDQLTAQVSLICVSLSKEVGSNLGSVPKEDSSKIRMSTVSPESSLLKELSPERRFSTPEVHSTPPEDTDLQILDSVPLVNRIDKSSTIVLSDDEEELHISHPKVTVSEAEANKSVRASEMENLRIEQDAVQHKKAADKLCSTFLEREIDDSKGKLVASLKSKDEGKMETKSKFAADISISGGRVQLKKSSHDPAVSETKQTCVSLVSEAADSILKELVHDKKDDPQKTSTKPEKPEKQQQQHLVKLKVPAPKRQVIQLQTHAANKFGNLHRLEARGKRFKPPKLDEWYRPILEINYFATVGLTSVTENENRRISRLREVPSSFQSPEEYVEVFHPLVLEEFKAQLYSSFVEMSSWEDIHFGCLSVLSVERVDDFHFVRFVHDDVNSTSKTFSENDLVLITKEAPQKGSHDVHMVGKVERRERDNKQRLNILLIRFYFLNGSSRLNQARRQLVDRSKWHASRIMSITPQLREFLALSSIKDNPILEVILQPMNYSPSNTCKVEQAVGKLSQPLQKVLRSTFNDSQLQAINVAIGSHKLKKDFELSLIQGPPGTGKTRTIVAIVSCLFSSLRGTSNTNMNQESGIGISFANARSKISKHVAVARAWQDAALARQINDDGYRNKFQEKNSERRRVLICAQSNAAVDELCSRIFSEGLYRSDGERYKPYLVRVGNVKTVHQNSLPFFIDTLVDQRLTGEKVKLTGNKDGVSTDSTSVLRSNLEKLVDSIRFYEAKCAKLRDGNLEKSSLENESEKGDDASEMTVSDLEVKLRKLYGQKKQFFKDLRDAEAKERKTNEEIRALRHKLRKSILKEAEIVLTTLSGCGGDLYGVCSEAMSSHKFGNPPEDDLFDAVVIDEAAQALEPATLIPLQLLKSNGTKCIMVGDPKQLPATVLSDVASKYLYECSMFERLERAGHPVVMLTKQYRMHPEICQFPSMHFYDNKLLNGEDTSCKSASFHETKVLGPYLFYDIMDGQELRGKNSGAMSLYNECEAEAAVELLRFFKKRYPSEFVGRKLGIITPYKSQLSLLRSRFLAAFGSSVTADFEFNTVDGFQGREVDILLLSTVRAADACSTATGSKTSTIGFVADVRRMNVALTRAKFSLWILGNSRTLMTNRSWKALLENAKERNLVISVERPYNNLFRNLGSSQPMENSKDKSKQLNHGGSAKEPGKLEKHRGQHGFHRNEKCVIPASQSNRMDTKHDNSVSTVKADGRDKRRAGDGNDPPGVADLPSVDVDTKSLSKKAAMSFELDNLSGVRKVHKGNKTKPNSPSSSKHDNSVSTIKADGREKRRSRDGNDTPTVTDLPFPDVDAKRLSKKAATSVELDTSGGRKGHKSSMNKPNETKKSNCHGPTLSVEGNTECGESQHTKTPKVSGSSTDRKQQRQAVDAILCSFLLPSKKGEPLAKSAPSKRPRSPTRSLNNGRKPPKTKRVHENEQ